MKSASVHPFSPVSCGVRLATIGMFGSPAIFPPDRCGPWHPLHTCAMCAPSSTLAASTGGSTECAFWWSMANDGRVSAPNATTKEKTGPMPIGLLVRSTGGRLSM